MLPTLKDTASVWVFQANKSLSTDQINHIYNTLGDFIPQWAAHGVSLRADFEVVKDLFIIIGVDENEAQASGCSKDALTRKIMEIGNAIGIDFFDRMKIAFVNSEDKIELLNMLQFKNAVSNGAINTETYVFNNLVINKAELTEKWQTTVARSWHENLITA